MTKNDSTNPINQQNDKIMPDAPAPFNTTSNENKVKTIDPHRSSSQAGLQTFIHSGNIIRR